MSCLKAVRPVNECPYKKKVGVGGGLVVQKEQPRLGLTTLIRLAKNKSGVVGGGGGGVGGEGFKAGSKRSFYGVPG